MFAIDFQVGIERDFTRICVMTHHHITPTITRHGDAFFDSLGDTRCFNRDISPAPIGQGENLFDMLSPGGWINADRLINAKEFCRR